MEMKITKHAAGRSNRSTPILETTGEWSANCAPTRIKADGEWSESVDVQLGYTINETHRLYLTMTVFEAQNLVASIESALAHLLKDRAASTP